MFGGCFLVLSEGTQLSCRLTVAGCHKTLPSKMETDRGVNSDPSPLSHLSLVQMLFIPAFAFDAVLCLRASR